MPHARPELVRFDNRDAQRRWDIIAALIPFIQHSGALIDIAEYIQYGEDE
ncbi:hypothetical protein DHOM_02710 [Dermabacter hominis 1368]|uniref:Uncharacterized protein n=1 Tax=Dermabacter hominis 1368 TaxID=1450519 RepID=A0ABR4SME2_9MICO|nr:hypothetical protein DHOM_02710 [Dermabacter hominis 1368]